MLNSLTDIGSWFIQGSAINQVRLIQIKLATNNANDEESDHSFLELYFELGNNPTQFGVYSSPMILKISLISYTLKRDEKLQKKLLIDEMALCSDKDDLTQIFENFNTRKTF